jgi:hypothetical protein
MVLIVVSFPGADVGLWYQYRISKAGRGLAGRDELIACTVSIQQFNHEHVRSGTAWL